MGKVIEAQFEYVIPGNFGVKPEHILRVAKRVMLKKPLFPLVARKAGFADGRYVTLDSGNSRIIYTLMAKQNSAPMFVADSDSDSIPFNLFYPILGDSIVHANESIKERWNLGEVIAWSSEIKNFRDYYERLVRKYSYLGSVPEFLDYCIRNRKEMLDSSKIIGRLDELGQA